MTAIFTLLFGKTDWFGSNWDTLKRFAVEPTSHPMEPQFHRPMSILLFMIQMGLFGLNMVLYHLVSLGLHAMCAWFLFRWLRKLSQNAALAFFAGASFTLYPGHVEAVTWISAVCDPLALVFALAGLDTQLHHNGKLGGRWRIFASALLFFLSANSKEPGIAAAPLGCFVVLLMLPGQDPGPVSGLAGMATTLWRRLLATLQNCWPYLLVVALYFGWRYLRFDTVVGGYQGLQAPPWQQAIYFRIHTLAKLLAPLNISRVGGTSRFTHSPTPAFS